ncbi:MAG: divalent-cation tolerance protein CutA [Spirochaetales bacterium]|nr:divalent-cation tolerance protein CutA [Spirochaetales bacterium]
MAENNGYVMILIAAPVEAAAGLARSLVEGGAAACAQATRPVTSFFKWKGELREEQEALVLVKTAAVKAEEVKRLVAERHPYEVPEVVVLPLTGGNPAYFRWIDEVLGA